MRKQVLKENISVAISSIKSQTLRTVLTAMIIAIGITALIGILTAVDAIKASIQSEFTNMGANTFVIQQYRSRAKTKNEDNEKKRITYFEAKKFKEEFKTDGVVSIFLRASFNSTIKHKSEKTNPNVTVMGVDENYTKTAGYSIEKGRDFSNSDLSGNRRTVLIGSEINTTLFKNVEAIGNSISVNGVRYKVAGVLKEKGSSSGMGGDRLIMVPLGVARQYFGKADETYTLNIMTPKAENLIPTIEEATGKFRQIRKIPLSKSDDFEIRRSDSLASKLIESTRDAEIVAAVIGLITLLGAAIGLMNIMLVSVTERTHEIGVRKALGASPQTIKIQFLTEAVVICQLGGIAGIVLGILVGNITSILIDGAFVIPWLWIIGGFLLCFFVGVLSGYYPSVKAAKLDPIEALRYE